jgi:hypothetical protein
MLAAAAAVVVLGSAALVLTFDYGRDQGIYAVVARVVAEGGMPYRDAWDFKPPGIYLVYLSARAALGTAPWAVRALEAAGLCATAWGLVRFAERLWGSRRVGLAAACIAALVHVQLDFWHTGQPETFGGMLTVAALCVCARRPARAPALVAAGVLFGMAGLLKPPLAGGALVLAAWHGWPVRRSRMLALRPAALLVAGVTLPLAACAGWFAARGALGDLSAALFDFTPRYTALGWSTRSASDIVVTALVDWSITSSSLVAIGLVACVVRWRRVRAMPGLGLLLGVVGVQLAGVVMQAKLFHYHYAACWPLTALVAALGWREILVVARAHGGAGRVAFAAVGLVGLVLRTAAPGGMWGSFWQRSRERALFVGGASVERRDRLATVGDVDAGENRAVAGWLARRVPAGAPIYLWAFEPIVYELSDRPAASRFIYNVPQRTPWAAPAMRALLMADLARRPPAAVVVAHHDAMPWVIGDDHDSADALWDDFDELADLVQRDYERVDRIGDFDLFLAKTRP